MPDLNKQRLMCLHAWEALYHCESAQVHLKCAGFKWNDVPEMIERAKESIEAALTARLSSPEGAGETDILPPSQSTPSPAPSRDERDDWEGMPRP